MAVVRLLFSGRPTAIRRLIISVVVLSVDGVSFGPRSHVGEEIQEHSPSLANGYSPTSVSGIVAGIWVQAAFSHRHPNLVFRRFSDSF